MNITALRCELVECHVKIEQVVFVETAGPLAAVNVLGQILRVLGSHKLLILRRADVDEGLQRGRAVGRLEGRVVDGVAVDLADVQVLLDLGHLVRDDAVGDAPDLVGGLVVVVRQGLPVGSCDEGDDAAWGFGGASVILAFSEEITAC